MKKRKICVFTGSRADFGLLKRFINFVKQDPELKLQIVAGGSHFLKKHGFTYREIFQSGLKIDKKIKIGINSYSSRSLIDATGLTLFHLSKAYKDLQPDIIVVLGDRYEVFAACYAALINRIPLAHFHGGELTEGAVDDALRHSITKMSHIHFVASKEYYERVVQLGESKKNIHLVGGLGVDSILNNTFLNKSIIEKKLDFKFGKKNLLVTFHPETLKNKQNMVKQFRNLLSALDNFKEIKCIFTKPNVDIFSDLICDMIDKYVVKNKNRCISIKSMGQQFYLSTLKYVDAVVGNSSSGLLEVPSLNIGTINIGIRQKGRLRSNSIIDCDSNIKSISNSIKKLYNFSFQKKIKKAKNPHGIGGGSKKAIEILKKVKLNNILIKKFIDV